MDEWVEEYPLTGFDPKGEPMVRRTATGRLWLCLELVPPSWVPDEERTGPAGLGVWADLDRKLARAIQVPVMWEDREWFRIDQPREDTIALVHQLLLRERQWRDPHFPQRPGPGGPPEPFSFDYALDLGGYATARIGVGGRVTKLDLCGLQHALQHLADVVLQLTAGRTEDAVVFEFGNSPGEYQIDFRRAGEVVELTVWEIDQFQPPGGPALPGRVVLEGWCLLREVRERVTAVLERILAEHGLAGYRELAVDYDFPLDKLLKLRQVGAGAGPGAVT